MNRFKKWKKLDQYLEQGVFSFIDLAFAESVLKKLYRAPSGFVNFDSARQSQIETQWSERGSHSKTMADEEDRFGKVAASQNSQNLTERGIKSDKQEHAALLATLFALSRQGHLTLDLSKDALNFTLRFLAVPDEDAFSQLIHCGAATFPFQGIAEVESCDDHPHAWICRRGTCYYLQKNWIYESKILKHLERLSKHVPAIPLSLSKMDPRLNEAQRKGIENAMMHSLSLLTGGPGTGKTFTAAEIVKTFLNSLPTEIHRQGQLRIILTAPTGKAVSQIEGNLRDDLSSQIELRSGTLHAVLGIKAHGNEEETVSLFADLILVDECSMIDAKIFSQLLACIPNGARVVLIGDKDQLPPIESGSIFADILEANIFPASYLSECLRSDRREILTLSQHIKQGDAETAFQFLNNHLSFGVLSSEPSVVWTDLEEGKKAPLQLCANLWKHYKDRFVNYCLEKPLPEQILSMFGRFGLLSSMRQGPLGVDAINRYFLYESIKNVPQGSWWVAPIMITRNDYEMEVYNGDLGFLVRKVVGDFSLRQFVLDDYILLRDRKGGVKQIAALNLSSFEYSYCLSVHKSQGSEYDEAMILIPPGSESFGREILYTAITRARYKMTLMCSKDLFLQAIATSSRKTSGLRDRLSLAEIDQMEK